MAPSVSVSPDLLAQGRRTLALYDLAGCPADCAPTVEPLGDGLINDTFLVSWPSADPSETSGPSGPSMRAVLQRVHPVFGRAVHDDIEAVTAHLQARGLITPRLFRTRDGQLSVDAGPDGIWRLLSYLPGKSHARMTLPLAHPAGALVGTFHVAVADLQHRFHHTRPGAHDLTGHVGKLAAAVDNARRPDFQPRESPIPPAFFPFADTLLSYADRLPLSDARAAALPRRICHGDLKLNNLRFDDQDQGICLLDLDTLAALPLPFELGDALRSWCNPRGEDDGQASFDLPIFQAALHGYADRARALVTPAERDSLVAGIERIAFQLAVRFACDVVGQSYFRWRPDAARHPTRAAHNLLRAQGQFSLVTAIAATRSDAEQIVAQLFT